MEHEVIHKPFTAIVSIRLHLFFTIQRGLKRTRCKWWESFLPAELLRPMLVPRGTKIPQRHNSPPETGGVKRFLTGGRKCQTSENRLWPHIQQTLFSMFNEGFGSSAHQRWLTWTKVSSAVKAPRYFVCAHRTLISLTGCEPVSQFCDGILWKECSLSRIVTALPKLTAAKWRISKTNTVLNSNFAITAIFKL